MPRVSRIGLEVLISILIMYISGQTPIELLGIKLPLTLQSMFAILLPLVLNRRNAAGGILLYLVLAALGLPLLATGVGGYQYFLSNSGGYLVGFYLITLSTAVVKPWIKKPRMVIVLGIFFLQHIFLTLCGLTWIAIASEGSISFDTHVSPFLPGIAVKSFIGALLYEGVMIVLKQFGLVEKDVA